MITTRLCLVRHGETDWNAEKRIQGQLDPALNPKGVAQAEAVAEALAGRRFAALYSSDLTRAQQTAAAAAAHMNLPVQLRPALRERNYGIIQGLTYDKARERCPADFERFSRRDLDVAFQNGESLRRFAARVTNCLEEIVQSHPGQQIVVVAHGGVLDIVHRLATGNPLETARDFVISNAALNWLECNAGHWHILSWNELPGLNNALDELPG